MMKSGLVSVSFRKETPCRIVEAAKAAGLDGIEWGGDVHVPAGENKTALEVGRLTREAGLAVTSYGSYYRVGCAEPGQDFERVLETAKALGATLIRVWAGNWASRDVTEENWRAFLADARRIGALAQAAGVRVSFECHPGTLTDDVQSSMKIMKELEQSALSLYWQPNQFRGPAYNQAAARTLAPFVTNLHVFNWNASCRFPLADGENVWRKYLEAFRGDGKEYFCLLEFMPDDRMESLAAEAAVLKKWLEGPGRE